MSNSVTAQARTDRSGGLTLYTAHGERKYLNRHELNRFLAEAMRLPPERALFALMLAFTGARVSEILALRVMSIQVEALLVTITTLKQRGGKIRVREIGIPKDLTAFLERQFFLRARSGIRPNNRGAFGRSAA